MNPPSQYEDIWTQLKLNGTVKLTANPLLHPRIIKATKKRKYIDMGFRMFLLEQRKIGILSHSINASVITFVLEQRPNQDFRTRPALSIKDI